MTERFGAALLLAASPAAVTCVRDEEIGSVSRTDGPVIASGPASGPSAAPEAEDAAQAAALDEKPFYGGTIAVSESGCRFHVDKPISGRRIKFKVLPGEAAPPGMDRQTIIDFGRLDGGHTFRELEKYIDGVKMAEAIDVPVEKQLPSYFDNSLEGTTEIVLGGGHGGIGPAKNQGYLVLNPGWWGTWFGPKDGATPGTYAVICYQRSDHAWRPLGVAGPVEVE